MPVTLAQIGQKALDAERARLEVLALERLAGQFKRGDPFEERAVATALDMSVKVTIAQYETEQAK
jgi:hypothetical protein